MKALTAITNEKVHVRREKRVTSTGIPIFVQTAMFVPI